MDNNQPAAASSNFAPPSPDTEGMDQFFDTEVTPVMSDKPRKRFVEVPIQQAAQSLGVSERTLWRRIEDGELKSRLRGNKRYVRVPLDAVPISVDTDTAVPRKAIGTVIDFDRIVQELNSANYRIGYLQGQLEIKDQQLRLLPDLQSKSVEAETLKIRLAEAETQLEQLRKSWWQKILHQLGVR